MFVFFINNDNKYGSLYDGILYCLTNDNNNDNDKINNKSIYIYIVE